MLDVHDSKREDKKEIDCHKKDEESWDAADTERGRSET